MTQEHKEGNLKTLEGYYEGAVVSAYEQDRLTQASWHAETRAFESYLDEAALPVGSRVLDVPIGTGRFIETFARRGFSIIGRDISADMVASSLKRIKNMGVEGADIAVGDGTNLDLGDKGVEMAVTVRFLVHLELPMVDKVLAELARVSSKFVIAHVRLESPGAINAFKRAMSRTSKSLRGGGSKKVSDKSATIHRPGDVHALFAKHRLSVLRDTNVNPTSKGYESRLYLLKVG